MTRVAFAPAAYGRAEYGLPEARLMNLFVEATPGGPGEDARLPRPGLALSETLGDGPVRGLFRSPGVFGGDLFVASGDDLYRAGILIGSLAGTGAVKFAASGTALVVAAGGTAQVYDGASLSTILDPDLPSVSDVAFVAGRFVYAVHGSDRFYWSEVGEAAAIDGLAFATAEGSSDPIVGFAVVGDELMIFGSTTVEVWDATGDPDTPFQRSGSKRYARGCASQRSIAPMDNGVIWVGDDGIVYRAEAVPMRISNHGIEARLRRSGSLADLTAFAVSFDGHSLYVLNIEGSGAFALDLATNQWAQWTSAGRETFRCACSEINGSATLLGDGLTGDIWTIDTETYADNGEPITFLASAFAPHEGAPLRCDSVVLQGARGVGLAAGHGSAPVAELRFSDDLGRTWSAWRAASVGPMGRYSQRAAWRRLGLMREPGRAFEVRTTDPVLGTMAALLVNEVRAHG